MRRREFIAGLGVAAAWPIAARAQQRKMPVIGFLHSGSPGVLRGAVAEFREGLKEAGYVEGQNVAIEFRWANLQFGQLPMLAKDLIHHQAAVIVAAGCSARTARERGFETAFASLVERKASALIVGDYAVFAYSGNKIVELAAHHKIPAIYPGSGYVRRGGLMSYGSSLSFRQVAVQYVGPLLKGAKPADLPIQQPTKLDFVINLKTAKALNLEIPPSMLPITDQGIE